MLIPSLALLLGAAALWVGGGQFVLGTSRLAERTNLPTVLVGMVVAGFGTSTPELVVSLVATARGEGGLALGNAVGSNVANVLLVLPLTALLGPWTIKGALVRREVFAVLAATGLLVAVAVEASVSRPEAGVLLGGFAVAMLWLARAALRTPERRMLEAEIEQLVGPPQRRDVAKEALRTLVGLGVVLASAEALVWGAIRVADELGVAETAVGLTIVAVGTSLPEVVTALVAARRGEPDLVLGNVLGSNLFNTLLIVGVAGLVAPLPLAGSTKWIALSTLSASAALLLLFLRPGFRLTRKVGIAGLLAYAAFLAVLSLAA